MPTAKFACDDGEGFRADAGGPWEATTGATSSEPPERSRPLFWIYGRAAGDRPVWAQSLEALRSYRTEWDERARAFKKTPELGRHLRGPRLAHWRAPSQGQIAPRICAVRGPIVSISDLTMDQFMDLEAATGSSVRRNGGRSVGPILWAPHQHRGSRRTTPMAQIDTALRRISSMTVAPVTTGVDVNRPFQIATLDLAVGGLAAIR